MRLGGLAKGNILATGLITIPPFLYMTYVIDVIYRILYRELYLDAIKA